MLKIGRFVLMHTAPVLANLTITYSDGHGLAKYELKP